jgi:hydrogenase/urease accessory protein HupE
MLKPRRYLIKELLQQLRSPLAPLQKGGTGELKVPLLKGDLGGSPTAQITINPVLRQMLIGAIVILTLITTTAQPSHAHWADLSVGEITIGQNTANFTLTIPTGLVSIADDNRDGKLNATEVDRHNAELTKILVDRITLFNQQGESGKSTLKAATQDLTVPQANAQTHSTLQLDYAWTRPIEELTLRYNLFVPDAPAARSLITTNHNGKTQSLVFTPKASEFTLIARSLPQQIYSFAVLGFEHILTGYDHILFLISLLLASTSFKYLVKIVTAFTISHSVTLSLAVLNIVSLPTQMVECAIALTIIYVAAENLWKTQFNHRWALTFGFGLVHGLGFSGVLREIQIPRSNLFTSLASFNLGVEIGQVFAVTVCYFLLQLIQKMMQQQTWQLNFKRVASVGIIVMGLVWFVERAFAIWA